LSFLRALCSIGSCRTFMSYQAVEYAFTTKYLMVAGIVMLFYDHILTFSDEVQLVWKAPHSMTKYAFLTNRYLVTAVMLATLHETAGFHYGSFTYTDMGCKLLLVITISAATISSITANLLILHRVLALWQDSKRTRIFVCSMHVSSSCVHIALTVIVVIQTWHTALWSADSSMCSMISIPALFPALWTAPLFFEFSTIILVIYGALLTPRSSEVPIRRTLQKNGILFFLFVIFLRLGVVAVSASAKTGLSLAGLYFGWTGNMMFFNHSFIRLRQAETEEKRLSIPRLAETTLYTSEIVPITPSRTTHSHSKSSGESYKLLLIRN